MKAGRATDGIVYPDVGQQISELVSQQPGEAEAPGVKALVPRKRVDQYSSVVSAGYSRLDQLLRQDFSPLSSFGFVPRPEEWQPGSALFHRPESTEQLRELAINLSSDTKLQELADDLVTDTEEAPMNVQHFLTAGFRGIVFPPDAEASENPMKFIQERGLQSLDELRQKLFDPRANAAEKGSALLQFRAKLETLKNLADFVQNSFSDLNYLELSRVKAPLLC
jgi:hypothetical protein